MKHDEHVVDADSENQKWDNHKDGEQAEASLKIRILKQIYYFRVYCWMIIATVSLEKLSYGGCFRYRIIGTDQWPNLSCINFKIFFYIFSEFYFREVSNLRDVHFRENTILERRSIDMVEFWMPSLLKFWLLSNFPTFEFSANILSINFGHKI